MIETKFSPQRQKTPKFSKTNLHQASSSEAQTAAKSLRRACAMGLFAPADLLVTLAASATWLGVLHSCDVLQYVSSASASGLSMAAAAVSSSHLLYAAVWFAPHRFTRAATRGSLRYLGSNAVGVFAVLVGAAKSLQQAAPLGLALAATECGRSQSARSPYTFYTFYTFYPEQPLPCTILPFELASIPGLFCEVMGSTQPVQWLAATVLVSVGQILNAAIYAAIGRDGVYYGFKLGRPVPWCTG